MDCTNCHTPLPEGETLCPQCGTENAPEQVILPEEELPVEETPVEEVPAEETPVEEAPAQAPINKKKLTAVIAGAVAVLAAVVVLVIWAAGGFAPKAEPTEPTQPATEPVVTVPATQPVTEPSVFVPTMTDEEAAEAMDRVVATMGDAQLTNGQLSACFWMTYYEFANQLYGYGMDPSYFGLDITKPLNEQASYTGIEGQTWYDYFLEEALNNWAENQALTLAAKAQGVELTDEILAQLSSVEDNLTRTALSYGYNDVSEMVRADFGAGVELKDYVDFLGIMMHADRYYGFLQENLSFPDEEVEQFYDENPAMFREAGLEKNDSPSAIDVRHILITPEGDKEGTDEAGNPIYSSEQMAAARVQAQAILEQWAAGEATEDSFAALVADNSMDPGSASNGGLYEGVTPGQMVAPFNDWCFNPDRQVGDTGLVQTTYGIHVMYFSGVSDDTPYWISVVLGQLVNQRLNELIDDAIAAHPYEVDRDAIVISEVDLTASF